MACDYCAVSTTSLIWIIVVVAALLAVALVTGVVLARRRRISLTETEQDKPAKGYQAGGAITFTAPPPPPVAEPTRPAEPVERTGAAPAEVVEPVERTGASPAPAPDVVEPVRHPVADRTEVDGQPGVGDDAAVPRDSVKRGFVEVDLPEKASEIEEIEPTSGRLERLRGRLSRSRSTFGQSVLGLLGAGDLDEDSWTDIEDTLLMADLGAAITDQVVTALREQIVARGVRTAEDARAMLRDVLVAALHPEMARAVNALPHTNGSGGVKPAVVLVVGVNGVGKTTTTGKLARVLVADGRTVLLGAADTFRAAAADQLETWGSRVGASTVRGAEGADPASVAFEAVKRGVQDGVDTVLIDTAGRLHTKTGLMDELGKVKRVVEKQAKVDEVLLVLDATTGQNGLTQARVFAEVVDVTGIVLTKLDGTAKGGIVFQVQRELGVPVKLVGLGEGADHLAPFEPTAFVDALLN